MGFVGTKPTVSSNVVIADAGTIGSASDEDAIAIAADGSVTFSQDIELGHASDTTIARASAGQITVEGTAVLLAGAQTGITTILNASTKIGRDSDNLIDFATTDNKLIFRVEGVNEVELVQNALSPVTSDGVALGTGSLMWSDIFLASAGVVNFNNGNVTITHAAGKLTTNADLEFLRDANNADVKLTLGTSAAESLIIQVLNGGSNKTAEEIHFSTATASGTANHGKMVFDVDGTDIATIDDGGIDIGSGLTFSVNGTDIVTGDSLNSLSAGAVADGDSIAFIDSDDSNATKKEAVADLATLFAGTGLTASSSVIGVDASQTQITAVGTIATGVWQGTAIASAYLDSDTAHLSGTQTFSGAKTFTSTLTVGVDDTGQDVKFFGATSGKYMEWDESADQLDVTGSFDVTGNSSMVGTLTVGVDDTGHDVKFFGATSGKYMEWDESANQLDVTGSLDVTGNTSMVGTLTIGVDDTGHDVKFFGASAGAYMEWDESADQLRIMGASADATTSTGKLLLATSLTDINANDVIGKIEFQAPHEAGGTDAITVAAGIEAVAQGTFSASVNATDILFKTGHSEAATEKFRFTSQGEIGIGGTNYGTSGQILTSGGAGAAPSWADAAGGGSSFDAVADGAISAGDPVALLPSGKVQAISISQDSHSEGDIDSAQPQTIMAKMVTTSVIAVGWIDFSNGYHYVRAGTLNTSGSISWGSTVAISNINASNGMSLGASSGHVPSAWRYSSNGYYYLGKHSISGTTISATGGSSLNGSSSANQVEIEYCDSESRFGVIYTGGSTKYARSLNASTGDLGTAVSLGSASWRTNTNRDALSYDPDSNKFMASWRSGSTDDLNVHCFSISNLTVSTFGSAQTVSAHTTATATTGNFRSYTDTDNNSFVVVFAGKGTSTSWNSVTGNATDYSSSTDVGGDAIWAVPVKIGSSNLEVKNPIQVFKLEQSAESIDAEYNSNKKCGVIGAFVHSKIYFATVLLNDVGGSVGSRTLWAEGQNLISLVYSSNANDIVYFNGNGSDCHYVVPRVGYNNLAYIGVASSAISDGATGTITIGGGIGENMSDKGDNNFVPGQEYFVDIEGGLVPSTVSDNTKGAGPMFFQGNQFAPAGIALTTSTMYVVPRHLGLIYGYADNT